MHDVRDGRERHAWLSGGGPVAALQQNRGLHNQRYGLGGEGGEIGECALRAVCLPAALFCRAVARAPSARISVRQPSHENDFRVPSIMRVSASTLVVDCFRWWCGGHIGTRVSIDGDVFTPHLTV